MMRHVLASATSLALIASPIAANAKARASSDVAESQDIAGIGTFGLLIGLAILAGVIIVIADDSNDSPTSP